MKVKLTYIEFFTLVGLAHLAEETDKQMIAIIRAVAKITGETLDERDYGFAADLVYSPDGANPLESIKMMLSKMGIVHEKEIPDTYKEESGEGETIEGLTS